MCVSIVFVRRFRSSTSGSDRGDSAVEQFILDSAARPLYTATAADFGQPHPPAPPTTGGDHGRGNGPISQYKNIERRVNTIYIIARCFPLINPVSACVPDGEVRRVSGESSLEIRFRGIRRRTTTKRYWPTRVVPFPASPRA